MRILGIDPGLKFTGYGCVELGPRHEPVVVEAGVLRLKTRAPLPYRLAELHNDLADLFDEIKPQIVVVEKLFSHIRHVRTGILMAHARGVVLLAAQLRGLKIDELSATQVKRAVTGNGHASKHQVQRAIMTQCGLREPPDPPDVADAIAIALCAARRLAPE
ncbi:MAG: crossover junction endodeoxyribonuclease RuvC [Phycisphaerales bacterium]|nr:crossover junction endodeoxyribonuclease RuvC [Phycisphaerales bacterium]MCI0677169.1 crossover junction endodeoxyribonuclease RuvC [Phycisphaerales bacterium]